uniref:Protein kinase domain-containing protein n=1 Tax=Setaria digitata TaxID=48799 RepID=A0A915PNG9_9BILA
MNLCSSRVPHIQSIIDDYDEIGNEIDNARKDMALISAENVFYLVIGCIGAIVLVIGLLIFVYYRSIKRTTPSAAEPLHPWVLKSQSLPEKTSGILSETHPLMSKSVAKAAGYADSNDLRLSIVPVIIYEQPQVLNVKALFKELYADRNVFQILPIEELEGTFGEMKWAIWRRNVENDADDKDEEDSGSFEERVIVKTLKLTADRMHLRKFLEEALAFCNVPEHGNLAHVAAIASCSRSADPEEIVNFPLICYSHDGFGNLKKFLLSCRNGQVNMQSNNSGSSGIQTLRAHELVSMALQILSAVTHLHSFGFIHKDIATRNCLVSEIRQRDRLFVQICDSALSKDFFPNDYHCLGDNENRPMKWMAYESLINNSFNSSTDVWSFGVTLWELLSCGQQPYSEIDPEEMATVLKRGKRLPQPYSCPDELYGLMYCCWYLDYRDRPTTEQLMIALQEFNLQLLQYI